MLRIYQCIIQPRLDYAITLWGFTSQLNLSRVQRLQNRAARIITGNFDYINKPQNVNNIKRTWQLLHEALNKKPMHSKYEDAFLIGNIEVTNKTKIANGFNSFFANIGTTISDAVPQSTNAFFRLPH